MIWLCVLLIVLQSVGGRLLIHVVYTARIEHLMDARETAIAQKLKAEIGVTAHVKIQEKEDIQFIQGMGYGAPFLFSEETDGETQYYTLDAKSPHGLRHDYKVERTQEHEDQSLPKTLTDHYFSDYYFEAQPVFLVNALHLLDLKSPLPISLQQFADLSYLSIPTPPPQVG